MNEELFELLHVSSLTSILTFHKRALSQRLWSMPVSSRLTILVLKAFNTLF